MEAFNRHTGQVATTQQCEWHWESVGQ